MPDIRILTADCLEALGDVPDNSLDACVTDPPYGLSDHGEQDVRDCLKAWLNGEPYRPKSKGFMGRAWDAWCPGPEIWREVFRCLKPGAYLACFASTRTADLMSMAIRLAGFRAQNTLMWIFGSGFPKATSVSKAIDREQGAVREVVGKRVYADGTTGHVGNRDGGHDGWKRPWQDREHEDWQGKMITAPATEAAKRWDEHFYGLQAIKPSHEPILLFQKPHEGRPVDSILRWGCGALNVGACRIRHQTVDGGSLATNPHLRTHINAGNGGHVIAHEDERRVVIPNQSGRWPATILLGHVADAPCPLCNPNELESVESLEGCPVCGGGGWVLGCRRAGTKKIEGGSRPGGIRKTALGVMNDDAWQPKETIMPGYADPDGLETVDNWECVDGCPCGMFPNARSGCNTKSSERQEDRSTVYGKYATSKTVPGINSYSDSGSSARFFYQAKASRAERAFYCRDCQAAFWSKDREAHQHGHVDEAGKATWDHLVQHPTVKPQNLISWIARLLTPKGGTVLDPFLGTGTTAVACRQEGFGCLSMEQDPEYAAIARMRAGSPPNDANPAPAKRPGRTPPRAKPDNGQKTLF